MVIREEEAFNLIMSALQSPNCPPCVKRWMYHVPVFEFKGMGGEDGEDFDDGIQIDMAIIDGEDFDEDFGEDDSEFDQVDGTLDYTDDPDSPFVFVDSDPAPVGALPCYIPADLTIDAAMDKEDIAPIILGDKFELPWSRAAVLYPSTYATRMTFAKNEEGELVPVEPVRVYVPPRLVIIEADDPHIGPDDIIRVRTLMLPYTFCVDRSTPWKLQATSARFRMRELAETPVGDSTFNQNILSLERYPVLDAEYTVDQVASVDLTVQDLAAHALAALWDLGGYSSIKTFVRTSSPTKRMIKQDNLDVNTLQYADRVLCTIVDGKDPWFGVGDDAPLTGGSPRRGCFRNPKGKARKYDGDGDLIPIELSSTWDGPTERIYEGRLHKIVTHDAELCLVPGIYGDCIPEPAPQV